MIPDYACLGFLQSPAGPQHFIQGTAWQRVEARHAARGLKEETKLGGYLSGVDSEDRILGAESASPPSDKLSQGYRDDVVAAKPLVLKRSNVIRFDSQRMTRTGQQTLVSQCCQHRASSRNLANGS